MDITPEQSRQLRELDAAASALDREIQRLLAERQKITAQAGEITLAQEQRRGAERKKNILHQTGLDPELLARLLTVKIQRLEDENLWGIDGLLRGPRIMPGMVPVMVSDAGYCTQLVVHFDVDRFQGAVGFSIEDDGRRAQPGYDEKSHAEYIGVSLMGEYPVRLAEGCRRGEVKWLFEAAGYSLPQTIKELTALAQREGAWLHPRISEIATISNSSAEVMRIFRV